ncbi:hypothetical protein NQZ68_000768 [Dissostichus eleginoides]|nr:hypothetical protein NQZ68_000768 [Dissostichus eleginoides]
MPNSIQLQPQQQDGTRDSPYTTRPPDTTLRWLRDIDTCQRLATPDGIVISSVLGSVAAEGAEGTTGGEASDDSSITVVQIGQNGEYLGTARLPAQTEGTCYT